MSFLSSLLKENASVNGNICDVHLLLKAQCVHIRELIEISVQYASVGIVIPACLFIISHHYSSTGLN